MNPEQWRQVKAVFAAVLEKSPSERDSYLNHVSVEDSVRTEVESLLAAHDESDCFLEPPADEREPLPNGTRLGPYQILSRIGDGGMGEVYKGTDTRLDRFVAIKFLRGDLAHDPDAEERFRREARTIANLNHPHICTLYDVGQHDDADFLVMEYLEGETLAHRLASGPLPPDEALRYTKEIAEALQAAHSKGVLHRDLKPANIMLTASGSKLLDFGLAKFRSERGAFSPLFHFPVDAATISSAGTIIGTPAYMAPEQVQGKEVDARTDIFGLGAVLYEMLTARRAFGNGGPSIRTAILKETPPGLNEAGGQIPPEFRRILVRILAKNPDERYATAAEVLADLARLPRSQKESVRWRALLQRTRALAMAASAIPVLAVALLVVFSPVTRERFESWLRPNPLPREKLVAVLPFRVVSADAKEKPFSDGLTETLTAKLTQLTVDPSLQVVPAPEVRARDAGTVDDVRKEFGATLVLEGDLQQSGNRVRINVSMVDAASRRQLRAATLTIPASDPFAVQDQVVNAAIGMLQLELQPAERQAIESRGTQLAGAYDFYLQGLGYLQNYDKFENIENAVKAFNTALELDAQYADAYASRGQAYWKMYETAENGKDPRWIKSSRQDCQRSLALNKRLPAAHVCLGIVDNGTGNYEDAVSQFESAIASEPTNDDAYRGLADAYERLGKLSDAERTYRRAIELRPRYWSGYSWLGTFYYHQARYANAAAMFSQVIALAPDSIRGYYDLGETYNSEGRYADGIRELQHSIAIRPTAAAYTNLGNAYFYLRQYGQAADAYEQAVKLSQSDYVLWWNLADGYYWAPEKRPQAMQAYRQSILLAEKKLTVNPRDAYALGVLAYCHAMLGERALSLKYLRAGLKLTPKDSEMNFKAALVYNQLGDTAKTLTWLKNAIASGLSVQVIRDTPNFEALQSNVGFQNLIQAK